MVIREVRPLVAALLKRAANGKRLCSFNELHGLFGEEIDSPDVYDTLEAASRDLAPSELAIYSALMAKRGNQLPGLGFFDIFRNLRPDEYDAIAGQNTHPTRLTEEQRQAMAQFERHRVYMHAEGLP